MAKEGSTSFKGVPALEELAAIADGHQLYSAPQRTESSITLRYTQAVPVFAPNGDIMPHLELLPWMVNLIDFIVQAVEPGATRSQFADNHELGLVSGYFWENKVTELHSYVALRLGRAMVEADMWIKPSGIEFGGKRGYVGRQMIRIGGLDAHATYWVHDANDEEINVLVLKRLCRTLRHYEDWNDPRL